MTSRSFIFIAAAATILNGCGAFDALYADIPDYVPPDEEVGLDAGADMADTAPDVREGPPDTGPDVAPDATTDADAGEDATMDTGADAEPDADVPIELDPPQNTRAEGTPDGVRVLWSAVDGAVGYEVRVGSGAWQSVGSDLEFLDTTAPEGTLAGALTATASDATSAAHVSLTTADTATGVPGASVSYTVRAVAGDVTSDASFAAQGARTVGAISYRWQRTSDEITSDFTDIAGSSSRAYSDTAAPATGERRRFRVVASAEGTSSELASTDDLGWRLAAVKVVVGRLHNCALLSNAKVKCWGNGFFGQLGYGNKDALGDNPGEMPPPDVNVGEDVVDLALSDRSTCAVTMSGNVRCWGANARGQLGNGNTEDIGDQVGEMPPSNVPLVGGVREIVAGGRDKLEFSYDYYCALNTSGEVYCWGSNRFGVLGADLSSSVNVGDDAGEMPPAAADFGGRFVSALFAGSRNVCGYTTSLDLYCWGYGPMLPGALSIVNTPSESPPSIIPVSFTGAVSKVDIGKEFGCSLESSGALRCWGSNDRGQLGYGDSNRRSVNETAPGPVDYDNNAAGSKAVDVSVTYESVCVLTDREEVICWGASGISNALSADDLGDQPNEIPTPINFGAGVVRLSENAGATDRQCVILNTGEVVCWGVNSNGALGYGDTQDRRPMSLSSLRVPLW